MSTATASPTESTGHRTPVGQTRPLPPQQFFKRQQLRRLSTGSARTIEEPTGKASGSQSAIITTRRLSDEITGPAKGWSNGKPPWSREGALLVRSSTAPSLFMDRRPSLPTSASMERLHGSQASSSSPSSKGESPTYKGWPFFRQPDHDPDEALSNHRRRPSNSLMLHSRRDSASSVTSATGSPGNYAASRDTIVSGLRREVEDLKLQNRLTANNLHNMGQEQDALHMKLEAKSEEAERLNNSLRNAEKLYKSKEEGLSRQLQGLEADCENLLRELSKAKETIVTQKAKVQAAEQDKRELHATVQDRDSTNATLRKSLDRAQKEIDAHKARLAELEARRDSLEDELASANHRIVDLADIEEQFLQARHNAEELKLRVEELQAGPGFYAVSAPSSSAPGSVSQTLGAEMLRQYGLIGAEPSSPLAPRARKSSRRLRRPPIPPSPRPDVECLSTELEKADSDPNSEDDDNDSSDEDDNTEVDPDDSLADVSIDVPSTPLPDSPADGDRSMTSPPSYSGSPRGAEQLLEAGPSVEAGPSDAKATLEPTKVASVEAEPRPVVKHESKGVMTTDIVAATQATAPVAEIAVATTEATAPVTGVVDDKNAEPICNNPRHVNWAVLAAFIVVAFAVGVGFGAQKLSSGTPLPSLVYDPYGHIHTITSATGLPYSAWHRKGKTNVMENRGRLRRGRVPT
ncbi:uncharacterized protein LOC62_02G002174 [Vanrija pseudolonga]|nr:hypothetical protein LOC62_02G002174 [Vanrija pseudolonga]